MWSAGGPARGAILESHELQGILGKESQRNRRKHGSIVDVVVDRAGKSALAVIDFGGFPRRGSRKIAVDWDSLSFRGQVTRRVALPSNSRATR